jgi:hypothetical protein
MPLEIEPKLSASEIAQRIRVEQGIELHDDTVRDWMKSGVRGIVLENKVIGNRYFSSWESYLRFDKKFNGKRRGKIKT